MKYVNNKLTVFEVTWIDQDVVESTMLDNQNCIYYIYECKVVVVILKETLEYDTCENSISLIS